ncbi:MAG TPA: LCP family protein [Savagea sp.]
MNEFEQPRKKKRKLRKVRTLFTLAVFTLFGGIIYSTYQYYVGTQMAREAMSIEPGPFTRDLVDPTNPSVENILLLGVDDDGSGKSRTDTMMVLSWNQAEQSIKIVSFMRDIYAEIPGYRSYKLNTAFYLNGVQGTKDAIQTMFDIPIHHYALVDFKTFETMVDIAFPKGLEVNVEKEMSEKIGVHLMPGVQRLNGKEALGYARFRADEEGDFGRVRRQQQVLEAMQQNLLTLTTLTQVPKTLGAVTQFIETDMTPIDELSKAMKIVTSKNLSVETMTIPIEHSYRFVTYEHAGAVIEIDRQQNAEALQQFLH